MAKELFRPLYSPPGYKYKDAKALGMLRESETYWIRVRHPASAVCACKGKRGMPHTFRESTKTNDKSEAKAQLQEHKKNLVKRHANGGASVSNQTFSDMAARLRRDYEVNSRDVVTLNFRLVHLEGAFGIRRMIDITRD